MTKKAEKTTSFYTDKKNKKVKMKKREFRMIEKR